jgi:hypothetical protein
VLISNADLNKALKLVSDIDKLAVMLKYSNLILMKKNRKFAE